MYDLNKDPEVLKHTGDSPFNSVEETKRFLENYTDYKTNGCGRWIVIETITKEKLGWCGLKKHDNNEVDLGFRFHKKYWNKGFATEAAQACIRYGFDKLNLDQIIGRASSQNHASIRVLEKTGMKFARKEKIDGIDDAVIYVINKNSSYPHQPQ
jgi:RimJ/RimL family protein N-acetyltransferase